MIDIGRFWAGTEDSLLQHVTQAALQLKHGYQQPQQGQEPPQKARLLDMQGSVAVIGIRGSLTNGSVGYGNYVTTYSEIRDALIQAAMDPKVSAVLLDISSGGGAVNGVSDTAKLIRQVDGIKPVVAYAESTCCSAAYWLGSSARAIHAADTAEVGSVGVITVAQSYARMYQEMGIDATVIRAGEFKFLNHPLEPLTDKAKAVIQEQLDQLYGMFASYVADRRGMNLDTFNKTAGEGRVFIGAKGVEAGLIDSITSFDKLVSRLEADNKPAPANPFQRVAATQSAVAASATELFVAGGIDFSEKSLQSGSNDSQGNPMKQALTEQQLAALAEGAGVAAQAAVGEQAPEAPEAPAATEAAAEATEQAPAAETTANVDSGLTVVQVLQAQLQAAQAQVVDLTVELRGVKADLEGAKNANAGLRAIAQASVDRMKVALGAPAGVAAANDEALLAEHGNLRSTFEAKFKSGGVAAVSAAAPQVGAGTQPDPARQARIAATRLK